MCFQAAALLQSITDKSWAIMHMHQRPCRYELYRPALAPVPKAPILPQLHVPPFRPPSLLAELPFEAPTLLPVPPAPSPVAVGGVREGGGGDVWCFPAGEQHLQSLRGCKRDCKRE